MYIYIYMYVYIYICYIHMWCIDVFCAHVLMSNIPCYNRYYTHSFLLSHCWEQPGSLSTRSVSPAGPQSSQTAPEAVRKRILSSSWVENQRALNPSLKCITMGVALCDRCLNHIYSGATSDARCQCRASHWSRAAQLLHSLGESLLV